MEDKAKTKLYTQLDLMMQHLNKNFISLQDIERKAYVEHFIKVLDEFILVMKQNDVLFDATFQRLCGAGSYFDGLKVGKATEFDMDVVVKLPIDYKQIEIETEGVLPAFTKIKIIRGLELLRQHPRWTSTYRSLDTWLDSDGYLLQTKFRIWMEGVVNKALNTLPKKESSGVELCVKHKNPHDDTEKEVKYLLSLKKSGPAMTLKITMPGDLVPVDVDLVPVIEFKHPQWPPEPVRPLLTKKDAWFIVPKPKNSLDFEDKFWRLAFHEQERELIHGKGYLKPICRLLKKMRDRQGWFPLESYYIKTMLMWEVMEHKPEFWNQRLSFLFLQMIDKLQEKIKEGCIKYFWDTRYNLLEGMTQPQLGNYVGRLNSIKKILNKKIFEADVCDPFVIAELVLSKSELEKCKTDYKSDSTQVAASSLESSPSSSLDVVDSTDIKKISKRNDSDESAVLLNKIVIMLEGIQHGVARNNEKVDEVFGKIIKLEEKVSTLKDDIHHLKNQLNSQNRSHSNIFTSEEYKCQSDISSLIASTDAGIMFGLASIKALEDS